MEWTNGLQAGCLCRRKGPSLTPNPACWNSLVEACQDVYQCIQYNRACGKRFVVYLVLPGTATKIDIWNVKAAGVICVLGISVGLGSYLLYKLYDKFIRPVLRRKPSDGDEEEEEEETEEGERGGCDGISHQEFWDHCEKVSDVNGEDNMGNEHSKYGSIRAYYKKGEGVFFGDYRGKMSPDEQLLRFRGSREEPDGVDNAAFVKSVENLVNTGRLPVNHTDSVTQVVPESFSERESNLVGGEHEESGFMDESNFEESLIEIPSGSPSLSMKGNFSPTSLYEKNLRLDRRKFSVDDQVSEQEEVFEIQEKVSDKKSDNNNKSEISDKASPPSTLNFISSLATSSVLLTPPSEEESNANSPRVQAPVEIVLNSNDTSERETSKEIPSSSLSPDLNSASLDLDLDSYADSNQTDEDDISPIPPIHSPERRFRQELLNRLKDVKTHSQNSSTSSSPRSSTPDHVLDQRSLFDRSESLSEISSPEFELLSAGDTESSSKKFVNIEAEIHDLESEFRSISSKIFELQKQYDVSPLNSISDDSVSRKTSAIMQKARYSLERGNSSTNSSDSSRCNSAADTNLSLDWDIYPSPLSGDVFLNGNSVVLDQVNGSVGGSSDSTLEGTVETDGATIGSVEGSFQEEDINLQLGHAENPASSNGDSSQSEVVSVGEKIPIQEYAEREWRGDTPKSRLMKKAYEDIPKQCKMCQLCRIRGDNYCGIRAALYQALLSNLPLYKSWASKESVLERLDRTLQDESSGLSQWTFANRLSFESDSVLEVMSQCVLSLYVAFEGLSDFTDSSTREDLVRTLFNVDPVSDLRLMEGVKLLMFLGAMDLYNDIQEGKDVPVFAWLLFARDTSENVQTFLKNHLNTVGDSGGLEQVEMFLLGYSLGVTIRVFRLQQFGQDDFVSYYPDDAKESWPTVTLIAEDDRHYNVPVH